ncbi:hydroxycinnamoyltransferase [Spinacia oleracea]|uniref:Hydroxycinnamoyltransferase n=1 Tax=Spinacia oleracea TaxID=3562 RepID=A0A9R0IGM9_SPIOL|nr:hydroxycinnamoyltransferase-like [Spinacia oleracea]
MANEEKEKIKGGEVKVHSVLTVVSSTPVNPGKTCPLSAIDRAMGHHSLHVIFYFRSGSVGFDRIRPVLNEVLTLYPNVIGRLVKEDDGSWIVRCTDAGLRVHRATVGTSVDEWLRFASADDERDLMVKQEFPHDPQYWSPFRMQVTEFEGGGTAISLSCPHMLADPISLTLFIKSWTEACHNDVIVHPPFLHPQAINIPLTFTTPFPTSTSPSFYASKSRASNSNPKLKFVSTTFSFSNSIIKQSLSKICSTVPDLTPFDLLTALFWMRIAELKSKTDDNLKQSISICMDMRKHLHAPLPYGYFGNALHFSQLTMNSDKMGSGDLGQVAELVNRHVTGLKEEEFWSAVDWLNSRKDDQGKFLPPFKMYGPELTFVNMESMIAPIRTRVNEFEPLMYRAEFVKDQKPAHVSYHIENTEGEGLILVMPSPEEGLARRVTVTLPEEEMGKLLQDKVILSLDPTMLLSGRS